MAKKWKEIICPDCGAKYNDMDFKGFSKDENSLEWKCKKCGAIYNQEVS